ncbi:MAG TPA: glycosyltransferase [Anaerolineales bacterium]
MRILISGTTYHPALNGQAIFTVNLAEGLARRGHQVLMLGQSEKCQPYQVERNGVWFEAARTISVDKAYPGMHATVFPGQPVAQVVKKFRPDIIHIQDHFPLTQFVYKMARRLKIKVVGTNHFMPGNVTPYLPGANRLRPFYDWVLWRWMLSLYNHLDVVTAPSRTAAAILHAQKIKPPVYPVSCGVDLGRFHPMPGLDVSDWRRRYNLDPLRVVFLFVGRVDGEKRIDVLLRALRLLDREDIQLAVAGRGAVLSDLQSLTARLGLGDRVRFLGFVPDADLPSLLNSVDAFAMPSEAELLSIATLEAMASSRPVMAAKSQALPELVSEGSNGYLFQPGDPSDAARYIATLADHPERLPAMGAASLEKVRPHSLENTLSRYEEIYEAALAVAPARRPHLTPAYRPAGQKRASKTVTEDQANPLN